MSMLQFLYVIRMVLPINIGFTLLIESLVCNSPRTLHRVRATLGMQFVAYEL